MQMQKEKVAHSPIITGKACFFIAGFLYLVFMVYAVQNTKAQESNEAQYDEEGWRRIQLEDGTWAKEKVTYFLPDHLGGTDVEVDEHGTVVAQADYLPYGEDRIRLEEEATIGSDDHQFTGQEKDTETGLYYYGARYYDPVVGRFLSEDPWEGDLSDPQTLNKYTYVLGNPLKYIDPSGLYVEETGEIENGDTLGGITGILNGIFGTNYSINDVATFNGISNPDNIQTGDFIFMGAYNEDGSAWLRAYNSDEVTLGYWNNLTKEQQMITHYGRNLLQSNLPENISDMKFWQWQSMGKAIAHNLGSASGNVDYRGLGLRSGEQAIYSSSGQLVTSPENMGTYDFISPKDDISGHSTVDVDPWLNWGNSPQDSTTKWQRYSAYATGLLSTGKNLINSVLKNY